MTAVNRVLGIAGMGLVPTKEAPKRALQRARRPQVFEDLAGPAPPRGSGPPPGYGRPVDIDAWTALQTLRAAATVRAERARPRHPLDRGAVRCIDKAGHGRSYRAGASAGRLGHHREPGRRKRPAASLGVRATAMTAAGPSATELLPFQRRRPAHSGRGAARCRREAGSAGNAQSRYGRRPVVAVLDTGVRAHPWLDVGGHPTAGTHWPRRLRRGGRRDPGRHPADGERARADGDQPRQVIRNPGTHR